MYFKSLILFVISDFIITQINAMDNQKSSDDSITVNKRGRGRPISKIRIKPNEPKRKTKMGRPRIYLKEYENPIIDFSKRRAGRPTILPTPLPAVKGSLIYNELDNSLTLRSAQEVFYATNPFFSQSLRAHQKSDPENRFDATNYNNPHLKRINSKYGIDISNYYNNPQNKINDSYLSFPSTSNSAGPSNILREPQGIYLNDEQIEQYWYRKNIQANNALAIDLAQAENQKQNKGLKNIIHHENNNFQEIPSTVNQRDVNNSLPKRNLPINFSDHLQIPRYSPLASLNIANDQSLTSPTSVNSYNIVKAKEPDDLDQFLQNLKEFAGSPDDEENF